MAQLPAAEGRLLPCGYKRCNDAQRAGMIDPSLKRPWRRRAQRLHTATVRLGCPTAGNPTVLLFCCTPRRNVPAGVVSGPQCCHSFVPRPPMLAPPGTSTVDLQDAHAGPGWEAELGFCRSTSLPLLGKACPLTRERVLSAGEHGRHGVAPDASQSTSLR